jgi:hypothetical protein
LIFTLKDEDGKEPMEKPFTLYEVFKKININLICMNILPTMGKIVQPCYNNLLKPMFYSKTWMPKLKIL